MTDDREDGLKPIDYEALGHTAYGNMPHYGHGSPWSQLPGDLKGTWTDIARAVVVAYEQQLRDQGFVVMRAEALAVVETARRIPAAPPWSDSETLMYLRATDAGLVNKALQVLDAALAAPDDGGEESNG